MLTIRLSRIGKKKTPMYRLLISEKTKDPYGNSLEILGSYNPFTKELVVKKERIEYWLKNGSQMSPTVNNLLIDKKIISGEKVKASKPGKKEEEAKTESPKETTETTAKPESVKEPEKQSEVKEEIKAEEKKPE